MDNNSNNNSNNDGNIIRGGTDIIDLCLVNDSIASENATENENENENDFTPMARHNTLCLEENDDEDAGDNNDVDETSSACSSSSSSTPLRSAQSSTNGNSNDSTTVSATNEEIKAGDQSYSSKDGDSFPRWNTNWKILVLGFGSVLILVAIIATPISIHKNKQPLALLQDDSDGNGGGPIPMIYSGQLKGSPLTENSHATNTLYSSGNSWSDNDYFGGGDERKELMAERQIRFLIDMLSPIVSQLLEREGYHLTDYIASRWNDESIVLKGSPQHNALAWLSHAIVCRSSHNQNQNDANANANANEFESESDCMSLLSRSQLLDRYALATIYFAWNGKSWRNSEGWLTYHSESVHPSSALLPRSSKNSIWSIDAQKRPSDVCLWQGITCRHIVLTRDSDGDGDGLGGNTTKNTTKGNAFSTTSATENAIQAEKGEQQQIIGLDLSGNNLIGYMGAVKEIRLLAYLEDLNLSQNHLEGLVPKDLSQLEELRYLDLSHNLLSGILPALIPKNLEVFKMEKNLLVDGLDAGIRFALPCSDTEAPSLLWKEFSADCSGAKPKVLCPCCTKCCGRSNTSNLSAVPKTAGSLRGASKNETTVCQDQTIPEKSAAATAADTFATVVVDVNDDYDDDD
jgi:hypothetical protein